MIDKERLDKLLNAYIDGELGQREQTEVKRLLLHDEHIAKRHRQLEKYRQLLSALPREETPAQITKIIQERVRSAPPQPFLYEDNDDRAEGVKQLLMRKVLAAAAMIALAVMLGAVVYTIIEPNDKAEMPIVLKSERQPEAKADKQVDIIAAEDEKADKDVLVAASDGAIFSATLELNTFNKRAVSAFIRRTIADNNQILFRQSAAAESEGNYTITGSKEGLSIFLADMATAWNQFNSSWLYVEKRKGGPKILISNITPQQIDKMAAQPNTDAAVAMAEDFAALNRISGQLTNERYAGTLPDENIESMPIPKPALTWGPEKNKKQFESIAKEFELTIVVTGTE